MSFKPESIIAGFRSCGIFPWNPLIIPTASFEPASTYDNNKSQSDEHPLQWIMTRIALGTQTVAEPGCSKSSYRNRTRATS